MKDVIRLNRDEVFDAIAYYVGTRKGLPVGTEFETVLQMNSNDGTVLGALVEIVSVPNGESTAGGEQRT